MKIGKLANEETRGVIKTVYFNRKKLFEKIVIKLLFNHILINKLSQINIYLLVDN